MNRFSTFLATARKNFGGLVLSGANQAVSSLTNFAALLYLIRVMNKETFGLYGLGLSGVLFITGLMSAAIGMQLAINLPDKEKDLRDIYAVNHAGALVILGMLLISASPIAAEILEIISNSFAEW